MEDREKKSHRAKTAGAKAEKKKAKKKNQEKNNPRAFTFQSAGRAEKQARRNADIGEKKLHVPRVDRTPLDAPPVIIAVVGPPGAGKSTLIKSLVKKYTKHNLAEVKGPITVVSGKKRRLTFIECANDMNSMIDIAKIADLVLLLIDASYGFEMETFEFLNILQTHGFPKIMGVLTHLDKFRNNKTLRTTKKRLKHRFWTEIYQGAKLFYLSGTINNKYPVMEVQNLSRFISVMKFRPLVWRNTHPYILADRIEDLTPPDEVHRDPKCERTVTLYGYMRGTNLKHGQRVHIPGAGDFTIDDASLMLDPCPLPEKERKRLDEKSKLIYAPMSDVGGVMYDKDAVYINVPGSFTRREMGLPEEENAPVEFLGEGERMVMGLQDIGETLAERLGESKLRIFAGSEPLKAEEGNEEDVEMDEDVEMEDVDKIEKDKKDISRRRPTMLIETDAESGRTRRRAVFGDESDLDEDEGGDDEEDDDEEAEEDEDQNEDEDEDEEDENEDEDEDGEDEEDDVGNRDIANIDESLEDDYNDTDEQDDNEEDEELQNLHRRKFVSKYESRKLPTTKHDMKTGRDSDNENQDVVYAESDDDLGFDEDDENEDEDDENEDEGFGDEETDEEDNDLGGASKWKENLTEKANQTFFSNRRFNLLKLIYEERDISAEDIASGKAFNTSPLKQLTDMEEENADDNFFQIEKEDNSLEKTQAVDAVKTSLDWGNLSEWDDEDVLDSIRDRFITGNLDAVDGGNITENGETMNEDEVYGDFEDLESGEKSTAPLNSTEEEREALAAKKAMLKRKFDAEYDNISDDEENKTGFYEEKKSEIERQLALNREEFEDDDPVTRSLVEGFRMGQYVRILLRSIPSEFVRYFDPAYPVIVGGIGAGEEGFGFVQARLKRHRWHKKILKTNDPLIFSIGWRRFQSIPIYSLNDGTRERMLKYTPEHMHCLATFYGPIHVPNTGICCVQSVSDTSSTFRISATGVVQDINQSVEITKKLKLTGAPYKIFKNTAFVKDMFNSALEVAKFEGAHIKTVSGVRGQVKKPLAKPDGAFRATFEDKILMSDIIFLRAWYPIKPRRFYNPVTSLLLSSKTSWQGMRLTWQIRKELETHAPSKADSIYKPIIRQKRRFNTLKIPKSIAAELPFASKPKNLKKRSSQGYLQKRAVVLEPDEKRVYKLMQQLNTLRNEKTRKRKEKILEKKAEFTKKMAKLDGISTEKEGERRKDYFRKEGIKAAMKGAGQTKQTKKRKVK